MEEKTQGPTALTQERLDKWREKHGDILRVKTPFGELVFRTPARGDFNRFTESAVNDKSKKATAMLDFARSALIHPAHDVFEGILDKKPGYLPDIVVALRKLAGGDQLSMDVEGN